jgi:hypothetical protein
MISITKAKQSEAEASPDKSRRSFFSKMGAGVATAVASTAALASGESADESDLSLKVALLEEEKALRRFHQSFEQAIDKGLYDAVVEMFAADAEVIFNGGIFDNRRQGVSRLYRDRFKAGRTGKRMEPAPGFELDADQLEDSVFVAADRVSATAEFPYSIRVGEPVETGTSLAGMARLHGEGIRSWWEGGIYKVSYRKDVDGRWKINRLEYQTLSRADYRPGRTYAMPISVALISIRYPKDPQGPDSLV